MCDVALLSIHMVFQLPVEQGLMALGKCTDLCGKQQQPAGLAYTLYIMQAHRRSWLERGRRDKVGQDSGWSYQYMLTGQ